MQSYDFRLETPRDVAVYVSTLFTLIRNANSAGKIEAVLFLSEQVRGMVPDAALAGFLKELRQERQASPPSAFAPEPEPIQPEPAPSAPEPAREPERNPSAELTQRAQQVWERERANKPVTPRPSLSW